MSQIDELYQRNYDRHPPVLAPEYKTSVLRSPKSFRQAKAQRFD
ncbi:MAG: hypothetical protein WBR09_21215 [Serratia proteamaculans]|jgi:protocatechuate 3,4-dioxygenase beta subunit